MTNRYMTMMSTVVCCKKGILGWMLFAVLLLFLPSCKDIRDRIHFGKPAALKESRKTDSTKVVQSTGEKITDSVKTEMEAKKAFERTLTDSLMAIETGPQHQTRTPGKYYIIAGSFSVAANANRVAARYASSGYDAKVIYPDTAVSFGHYLVSLKVFGNYDEASVYLKEIRKKVDSGAWIWSQN
jgi:cell division protein FtsN